MLDALSLAHFSTWFAALLVGLMGGVHCLGMCGGIVGALSIPSSTQPARISILLGYNLGRIVSYSLAGALVATLGYSLIQIPALQVLRPIMNTLAALLMIALGLYLGGFWSGISRIEQLGIPIWKRLQPLSRPFIPADKFYKSLILGAIWGWLPCGMVYSLLLWTVSASDPLQGAGIMLAFGMGTLPNLLLMGLFTHKIRPFLQRPSVRKMVGLFVTLLGILLLWQALSMWG